LRIARREVLSDIARPDRAEQGIDQGMDRDVGIAVPG
jgi:hypothetical protein